MADGSWGRLCRTARYHAMSLSQMMTRMNSSWLEETQEHSQICEMRWMAVRLVAKTESVFRGLRLLADGVLVESREERQPDGGMWRVWRISRAEDRQF